LTGFYPIAFAGLFSVLCCDFVPSKWPNFGILPPGTFVMGPGLFLQSMRCTELAVIARATANRGRAMLSWVVTFLIVALIAGILGFGGIAGASVEIAKAIFFIAVILFLISAVVGLVRGRSNV
jgi:uncharacterized membrane protein YtjA (UPF0391 family)